MTTQPFIAVLADRVLIRLAGPDTHHLLDRLVTSDVPKPGSGETRFGALLTPQGKILFDFFLIAKPDDPDALWLDAPAAAKADLIKRLTFYRLRADVAIEDQSEAWCVVVAFGDAPAVSSPGFAYVDPRLDALGWRALVPTEAAEALVTADGRGGDAADYHAHRIALAIPEGGADFAFGDAFPHDAGYDQYGAVNFHKGCFVGQEVVSRMEHRGSARRRVVKVAAADGALEESADVTAGGKPVGTLGTVSGGSSLAILRLDRAGDAAAAGVPILAGDTPVALTRPVWASHDWPDALKEAEDA